MSLAFAVIFTLLTNLFKHLLSYFKNEPETCSVMKSNTSLFKRDGGKHLDQAVLLLLDLCTSFDRNEQLLVLYNDYF